MMSAFSDLFGPIFAKELVEMARRWRYYLCRILLGSVLLLVLLIVYEKTWSNQNRMSVRAQSRMAEDFFLTVCWVQYLAIYLFVPLFVSGVISSEREQKTLELLFTTQLSNREIIWGKLGSRIATMAMLILSALPVIAITMLFGGVNPLILTRVAFSTLIALLFVSAFSMYFSVTTRSPLGALVRTYWWLLFWLFLLPATVIMLVEGMFRGVRTAATEDIVASTLFILSPAGSFFAATVDNLTRNFSRVLGPWFFWYLFIVPALWTVNLIWRSVRRVRIEPEPGKAGARIKRVLRWMFGWLLKRGPRRPGWVHRYSNPERAWFLIPVQNPFWLRARRVMVYDREGHLRRIQLAAWFFVVLFIAGMTSFGGNGLRDSGINMVFQSFLWIGLATLGGLVAGYSLIGDRRRGFFEIVLTTPLRPGEIIGGTVLSVWRHVSILYMLIFVLAVFFLAMETSWLVPGIGSLITASLFFCLLLYHGVACSLVARTVPGALIGTACLPLVSLIGTMVLIGFAREGSGPLLWFACAVGLPLSYLLVRRRMTVARVTVFLILMHLSLTALFSWWVKDDGRGYEYPLVAMHAGYLTIFSLERHSWSQQQPTSPRWLSMLFGYWIAVGLNIIWLHVWLCWTFESLSGRVEDGERRKPRGRPAQTSNPPSLAIPPCSPTAEIPLQ